MPNNKIIALGTKIYFHLIIENACIIKKFWYGSIVENENRSLCVCKTKVKNMSKEIVVKMMDQLEMVGFLKTNGTACRFVSLVCKTPVVKIRVGNPFGQVIKGGKVQGECRLFKVAKKVGIINANYNTSVRKRLADKLGVDLAEVEYENGEVWFKHILTSDGKNLPLVVNKDETKAGYYVQYFPHTSTHAYVNDKGETIADEVIQPYLYKETERPDYKPCTIAINLANICQFKASGVIIEMPNFDEAAAVLAD